MNQTVLGYGNRNYISKTKPLPARGYGLTGERDGEQKLQYFVKSTRSRFKIFTVII